MPVSSKGAISKAITAMERAVCFKTNAGQAKLMQEALTELKAFKEGVPDIENYRYRGNYIAAAKYLLKGIEE